MKACLSCGIEYQNKREASKFCSDKCRVKYNRTHPKPTATITPLQTQVLYNQVLSMLERFGKSNVGDFAGIPAERNGNVGTTSHTTKQALGEEKSFQQHMNEISELEFEEEFKRKAIEIQNAPNLSTKQKDLLMINMRQPKN